MTSAAKKRRIAAEKARNARIKAYKKEREETCKDVTNYDLLTCVKLRQEKEYLAIAMKKQEEKQKEKQKFFLYCQEHPYELRCIGTSEISQNLLCIVMFLLCLFFVIRK